MGLDCARVGRRHLVGHDKTPVVGVRSGGSGVPVQDSKGSVCGVRQFSERFEAQLSSNRVGSYLSVTSGSVERAIAFYEWNLSVSAEILKVLAIVEVVLRNTISAAFASFDRSNGGSGYWLSDPQILPFTRQRDAVDRAVTKLINRKCEPTLSAVIPERADFRSEVGLGPPRLFVGVGGQAMKVRHPLGILTIR